MAKKAIVGDCGSGKTTALARHVADLLEQGIDPQSITVVAANQNAKGALLDSLASPANVLTIQELGVAILNSPEAQKITGRVPRILNHLDCLFLFEDLKPTGVLPKRLAGMLSFFYREFTELGDDAEGFFVENGERIVYEALMQRLKNRKAMLSSELSAVAFKFVRDNPQMLAEHRCEYLFVDDYQKLNKASQMLVNLLAGATLTITANLGDCQNPVEPYPCSQGADEVLAAGSEFEIVRLDSGLSPSKTERLVWSTPEHELEGVSAYIDRQIAFGLLQPSEILVLVLNDTLGYKLKAALDARGVPTAAILSGKLLNYNSLLSYLALSLLANSTDVLAWRGWCGYGDYLTRSDAWIALESWAYDKGLKTVQALAQLAQTGEQAFTRCDGLVAAYKRGVEFIANNMDNSLEQQLEAVAALDEDRTEFDNVVSRLEGATTTAEIYARLRSQLLDPVFNAYERKNCICIGTPETLLNLSARTVVFCNLVDGLLPSSEVFDDEVAPQKRDKLCNEQRTLFHAASGKARSELLLSYFEKAPLELAELSGMRILRIRADDSQRVALLSPSMYLNAIQEMGKVADLRRQA